MKKLLLLLVLYLSSYHNIFSQNNYCSPLQSEITNSQTYINNRNDNNSNYSLSSEVYFYKIVEGDYIAVKRMILVK